MRSQIGFFNLPKLDPSRCQPSTLERGQRREHFLKRRSSVWFEPHRYRLFNEGPTRGEVPSFKPFGLLTDSSGCFAWRLRPGCRDPYVWTWLYSTNSQMSSSWHGRELSKMGPVSSARPGKPTDRSRRWRSMTKNDTTCSVPTDAFRSACAWTISPPLIGKLGTSALWRAVRLKLRRVPQASTSVSDEESSNHA